MRRLGLACAVLIALSSCDRSPTPIEPTSSSRSTSSASPDAPRSTAKPPTMPAAAKTNDETGAANFVLYWVKMSDYASLTGDTDLLRKLSSQDCDGCNAYIELYTRTYARGGWIRGGVDHLEQVSVEKGSQELFVRARVRSEPGIFKKFADSTSEATPAEEIWIVYAASHGPEGWRMTQIGLPK